jgi:tetratricopeptide (TPR) repeat protein
LLSLRLDELRQRDLQRRRKRQVIMALGFVAVLTLAGMTVVSQISERHEREKAEQLATFVVDLGERLKTDADLETFALISTEASRHLQGLDPDKLSPETGKKVALAVRQMAQVSQLQGKSDEALETFQRSRDLFSLLHQKHPELPGLLFELGNAEFYLGNLYFRQDQFEIALVSMQEYHRLTQILVDSDPDNPDWIMELAYSHNNLAALHLDRGMGIDQDILTNVAEATRLMETVVALRPDDKVVGDNYATILAWAADAQIQACNLDKALILRNKAMELTYVATQADPANNDLKMGYAFALTGVARLQTITGKLDSAEQNLEQTISILQQLSAADPSNVLYHEEVLFRQAALARLLPNTGRFKLARSMMEELESNFKLNAEFTNQPAAIRNAYIAFLLAYSDNEFQLGDRESASRRLQMVIQLNSENSGSQAKDMFGTKRLVKARYLWWQLNGKDNFTQFVKIPEFDRTSDSEFRSCLEADSSARLSMIEGDTVQAAKDVAYLRARGYADPEFMRFCELQGLCGG